MPIQIVFETHSTTEDNEQGRATGWLPGRLSARGRVQAEELGIRRADDRIAAVFCSDLARSIETADIAFAGAGHPILLDWRLRECDYGQLNGSPAEKMHSHRADHIDAAYPDGESWRQAIARVVGFLVDGHVATRWGFDHALAGVPLQDLVAAEFAWQPGWEYELQ